MQHDYFFQQDCYLLLMPFVRFVSKRTSRAQMHKRLEGFSVPLRPTDSLIIQWKNIFNQCTYTATVWDAVPWYAELERGDVFDWFRLTMDEKQVSFFLFFMQNGSGEFSDVQIDVRILWVKWIFLFICAHLVITL